MNLPRGLQLFVGVAPLVGGSGDKLGTVAFTACLVTWALVTTLDVPSGLTT